MPDKTIAKLYAVRSKDGRFFRSKGYGGYGKSWVDNLEDAKFYSKPGPAKAQITFWAREYPDYGVPELIILEATIKETVKQDDRVKDVIKSIELKKSNRNIYILEQRKKHLDDELNKLRQEQSQCDYGTIK